MVKTWVEKDPTDFDRLNPSVLSERESIRVL
jgi:hypothetical protein